jgi:hypothetical protein
MELFARTVMRSVKRGDMPTIAECRMLDKKHRRKK